MFYELYWREIFFPPRKYSGRNQTINRICTIRRHDAKVQSITIGAFIILYKNNLYANIAFIETFYGLGVAQNVLEESCAPGGIREDS